MAVPADGSGAPVAERESAVVVSITPVAVGRDSRTFKQAASIARMGHHSIVVEGEATSEGGARAFEIRSVGADPPAVNAPPPGDRRPGRVRRSLEPAAALYANARWNLRTVAALPAADLYVVHGWTQLPAAWRAARRHGSAVLYDAHDSYFERYPSGEDPEFASAATRMMFAAAEGAFARRAAGFLTSSDGIADLLERRVRRRPHVLVNYPDTRLDADPGDDVRSSLGLGGSDFLLVSVGNAKAGMDIEAGIRAMELLPERTHLALIGGGIEPYRDRVRELGLTGRVHVLGPVAPDHVNRFIRSADAGVILYYAITPDFQVAIPNRLFHAVAAGLPVLYPPLRGIASVAERFRLGPPIDSRDPESIATAARLLMEDGAAVAAFREAVGRAAGELTWESQEPLLAELIHSAMADGRPGLSPQTAEARVES